MERFFQSSDQILLGLTSGDHNFARREHQDGHPINRFGPKRSSGKRRRIVGTAFLIFLKQFVQVDGHRQLGRSNHILDLEASWEDAESWVTQSRDGHGNHHDDILGHVDRLCAGTHDVPRFENQEGCFWMSYLDDIGRKSLRIVLHAVIDQFSGQLS